MRQERIALFLLVGVVFVVLTANCALTILGKEPFAHPFTENSPNGELVLIEGSVERATVMENGGHLSLWVDNTTVFVPASAVRGIVVRRNDTLRAYGIVQTYRGKKEVVISSAEDLRITKVP